MRLIRWMWCVAVWGSMAVAGDAPPAAAPAAAAGPKTPNIILITLDTTRADRMGFLGWKGGLTPNLDKLAQDSTVFERAYAQAPLTSVSHATILTGTYPQYHGVVDFPMVLADDLPYAPQILRDHGYQTAAFLGSLALDPQGGAPGFDRGFDMYDAKFHPEAYGPQGRYQSIERRGEEVVSRALAWLDAHPKRPLFMWVHLYDAHDPYEPPEPYKSRYAEPYDGEIAHLDAVVGNLLAELKKRGLYDDSVMAVMADHGESLGAHGEDTHGVFVYDETIHVPLLVKLPKAVSAGKRVENRVELVDVMPTLLQSVSIDIPKDVQGKSLLELMKAGPEGDAAAEAWKDRGAYAQADYAHIAYGWAALQSLRTGKYLYIEAPKRELYDQAADPKAENNLAPKSAAVADTLAARLGDFRKKTSSSRIAPKPNIDAERMKELAALGYVVSASESSKAGALEQGVDPKDRIDTVNRIRRLNDVLMAHHYEEAIPVLEELAAKFSDMSMVFFKLGGCYMELKQYDKAVPALRRAVELEPLFTSAEMNLGKALYFSENYEEAAKVLEALTNRLPTFLDAQIFLELTYVKAERVPEAIKQCQRVLTMLPEHYGTNLNLGLFFGKAGDFEAAVPKLQKAASIRPKAPMPHVYLSQVYAELGRNEDAEREKAEAIRLGAAPPGPLAPGADEPSGTPQE